MIAACHGYLATLKLLAEFNGLFTLVDAYDDTVFTIAEYNSREEIVEWLITQGYWPSSETLTSPSPAKIHPDVAAWLDKYGSYSDPDGNWVFHIAARYGDLPTLVAQLHHETSHHKISIIGKQLFLIAVRYGHEHILDWLSRRGFHIEAEGDYEEAVKLAVDAKQISSLWFVINQKKLDIHVQESMMLIQASNLGHETIVSELLDRHPIQFFQRYQQDGSIALYAAIAAGHSKIVNRLLKAGAHFKSCITQYRYETVTLRFSDTFVPDAEIAEIIGDKFAAPGLEDLHLCHSLAAGDTLQALEASLKTNSSLRECTYPAVWQEPQYAMQFASIQKAIQRNCYRLWSAQWQLLLGVTACLTKLTPIIVLPRMSGHILRQIVSWLDWPLINWRFSQAIDVLQTYNLLTPESTAIDLSASEFIVEERKNQQDIWNSFDVAIDLSRDKLVEFALKPQLENIHRQLLAPEIRSAAAITSYVNE